MPARAATPCTASAVPFVSDRSSRKGRPPLHIATPGADRRFMQFGTYYSPAHDAELYGCFFPPRLARIMLLGYLSTTVSAGQEAPGVLPWDTAADPHGTRCGRCSV